MATIKAPFNFVPLSDKVFFPNWADQISQDIPFSDGISGTIDLKITAESPIFIRNGHTREDKEANNAVYQSFSKTSDGRYFIPATSIKGCIRNVLEIMSFGKMRLDKNAMFAQREWPSSSDRKNKDKLYSLIDDQGSIHCGWLKRKNKDYEIIDCGKPYRIGQSRIDEYIGKKILRNHFCKDSSFDITKDFSLNKKTFDPKTAAFKYELLKDYDLSGVLSFDYDDEYCNEHKDNRLLISNNGNFRGQIVLTGQPDKWMWPRPTKMTPGAGKFYEFVFLDNIEQHIPIPELIFNHFKFIYMDSPDWTRAKESLDTTGIPVFFRTKGKEIRDFGLAYLYKLPYDKSPYEALSDKHKDKKPDLAECIFGCSSDDFKLKGRVAFSNAISDNAVCDEEVRLALASPKASYYPIYILQNGKNGMVTKYQTYNDGQLAGWKRYPVRKNVWQKNTGSNKIDTVIYPLKAGAIFKEKIHFHNLRKIELGALLSALTFHNDSGCFHQIGQAKPFGYGKVRFSISDMHLNGSLKTKEYLMGLYEGEMLRQYPNWRNEQSIIQLFSMAHEQIDAEDALFKYMQMDNDKTNNEFLTAKEHKEFLQCYLALKKTTYKPTSLYEAIKIEEETKEAKRKKEEEERKKRIKLQFETLKSDGERLYGERKFEEAKGKFEEAQKLEIEDLFYKISECDNKINAIEKITNGSISECIKVSSTGAFMNGLSKWKNIHNGISEEDVSSITSLLKAMYLSLNKNKKKQWHDEKLWVKIRIIVGEDTSNKWHDVIINI